MRTKSGFPFLPRSKIIDFVTFFKNQKYGKEDSIITVVTVAVMSSDKVGKIKRQLGVIWFRAKEFFVKWVGTVIHLVTKELAMSRGNVSS